MRAAVPGAAAGPAAAIPGVNVAGTISRASGLSVRGSVTRARLRRDGLRVSIAVPARGRVVQIKVFRVAVGRRADSPIWVKTRSVTRAGRYRAVLGSRRLIARLRPGRYEVEVRTGRTRTTLGRAVTTRFTVSR